MERGYKSFDYQIVTDGLSLSIQFSEAKTKWFQQLMDQQEQRYKEYGAKDI